MKAKKILVVEDDRVTQKIIVDVLKSAGYEVSAARTAAAAVKVAREQDPDLITLDIELATDSPDDSWDGFSVAGWLRWMNKGRPKPVIVVISGHSDPGKLIEKAASVGVYTCLPKPIEKQKLLDAVDAALKQTPPPSPQSSPP
jgi:CheY-like chemotaxis protein